MTEEGPRGGDHPPRLAPTSPTAVTVLVVAGLVGGWLGRRFLEPASGSAPYVDWSPAAALLLVAALLGVAARATHRSVRGTGPRLPWHRVVNRYVLARSCALVGSAVAGGYAGWALGWVGRTSALVDDQVLRAGAAALAGAAVVTTALLLERACRVPGDPPAA